MRIFLLLFLFTTAAIAQGNYTPGHYINNSGEKVSGLIKNDDWKASPSSIQFKKSESAERETITLSQMQGFTINQEVTYVKKTVELDISTDNLKNLNYSKEPEFETRTGLLKQLVMGTANLYFYEKEGIREYFYSKGDSELVPLIYVRYLSDTKVATNERYKQELLNAFEDCDALAQSDFNNLSYKRNSLTKLFDRYNACSDQDYVSVSKTANKTLFNINVFAGANFTSLEITQARAISSLGDYGSQTAARFGFEIEALLPFNNNQWSLFTGLSSNGTYEVTRTVTLNSILNPAADDTLTYSTLNIPIGARYYIPLSDQMRLALQIGYSFDVITDITLDKGVGADYEAAGSTGVLFTGIGLHYKQFYGQATLDIGKDPFSATSFNYGSDVSSFNLVLGYQIRLNKQ